MATAPLNHPEIATDFCFDARVGAASWSVLLLPCAVVALDLDHGPTEPADLSADTWSRIMDSVRAKAVGLHWYGGGSMTIAKEELVPPTSPKISADGNVVSRAVWFDILSVGSGQRATLRLVA